MVTHSPQTPHYNLKYCVQVFNSYLLFNAFSALKLFFQKTQPKIMTPILFIAENLLKRGNDVPRIFTIFLEIHKSSVERILNQVSLALIQALP